MDEGLAGSDEGRHRALTLRDGWEPRVSDVVFIALIIVVFAVLALVVRGVECLVGQGSGGDAASGTVAGGDSRPELDGRAER